MLTNNQLVYPCLALLIQFCITYLMPFNWEEITLFEYDTNGTKLMEVLDIKLSLYFYILLRFCIDLY